MLYSLNLAVVLLVATGGASGPAQPCRCSALPPAGLKVNCSFLNLMAFPHLTSDTTELHVSDNQLTSVPPGAFDGLVALEKICLTGNPFHCDCGIQYLRNWLRKNGGVVSGEPTCSSPRSVAQTAIGELGDDYFSSCGSSSCSDGMLNAVTGALLGGLVLLLLWGLRRARASSITLNIGRKHSGMETDSLRPKHRRGRGSGPPGARLDSDEFMWGEDLERPLLNMELLPQVLEVLHRKHNIKIKLP
ncbi:platelet glycoprotein IX [Antennarius striatus]|uniref:platelet glycoprotein IX n=1 Tax=Antennarius striatus TaxID=241820 RepID=UPI0035AE4066